MFNYVFLKKHVKRMKETKLIKEKRPLLLALLLFLSFSTEASDVFLPLFLSLSTILYLDISYFTSISPHLSVCISYWIYIFVISLYPCISTYLFVFLHISLCLHICNSYWNSIVPCIFIFPIVPQDLSGSIIYLYICVLHCVLHNFLCIF